MSKYSKLLSDADKLEAKSMTLFQELSEKYEYGKAVQASELLKDATNKRMEAFDIANDKPYSYQSL
jgi:hypothetical protein